MSLVLTYCTPLPLLALSFLKPCVTTKTFMRHFAWMPKFLIPTFNWKNLECYISVGLIVLGAFVAGARDLSFDGYGYAVVFLSNITTAIYLATIARIGSNMTPFFYFLFTSFCIFCEYSVAFSSQGNPVVWIALALCGAMVS